MIYKCNMQELERAKVIVSQRIETAPKRKKNLETTEFELNLL